MFIVKADGLKERKGERAEEVRVEEVGFELPFTTDLKGKVLKWKVTLHVLYSLGRLLG